MSQRQKAVDYSPGERVEVGADMSTEPTSPSAMKSSTTVREERKFRSARETAGSLRDG